MYLDFTVTIPDLPGKIGRFKMTHFVTRAPEPGISEPLNPGSHSP